MAETHSRRDIVGVKQPYVPSGADLLFAVIAPITALRGAVKLTQSDGDFIAHVRMGQAIISTGNIPPHSLSSYTAGSERLVSHGWLSELILAGLYDSGGIPLVAVTTALLIGAVHCLIYLFLRRKGLDPRWALVAALMSFALASTHWLARPHMFSIAGTALTLCLLESRSRWRIPLFLLLFVLWTNLHGGWLYGIVFIAAYIAGDGAEALICSGADRTPRDRLRMNSLALGASLSATLINPYGIELHREVLSAATNSSLASNISEYLAPNFQQPIQRPFLLALLVTVSILALARQRMKLSWLTVVVFALAAALKSFRNIALFGVAAWPLIALHAAHAWPSSIRDFPHFREFARIDPNTRTGILAIPIAVLLIALGAARGRIGGDSLIPDAFSEKNFPIEAVARAKAARLDGNVFDAWGWAGYIMFAWPEARLHVDPLKFSDETIRTYALIENLEPGWQDEVKRWKIKTVIVSSKSPIARGLALDQGWRVWYRDSTATVLRPSATPKS